MIRNIHIKQCIEYFGKIKNNKTSNEYIVKPYQEIVDHHHQYSKYE